MPTPASASHPLRFGANIDPTASDPEEAIARAQLAAEAGSDLALMQDHPYNREQLDTWTVLGAIAAGTNRITLGSNVSPLPLRPPAMLAKAIATLSVLTHGRVILGLGAGGFPDAIYNRHIQLRRFAADGGAGGARRSIVVTTSGERDRANPDH